MGLFDWVGDAVRVVTRPFGDVARSIGLGDVVDDIEDGFDAAVDVASDLEDQVVDLAEEVGEGIVDALEAVGEYVAEDLLDDLDEAFSKDGWMTEFFEEYVPGAGFVTAIVHVSAGNESYAQAAAVKGAITTIEAAGAVAGSVAGGPVGGALGSGLGNAMGQLLEEAVRDELPEEVQHLFPEKTWDQALFEIGGSMAGSALGSGAGKAGGNLVKAGKKIVSNTAKEAAEEAVEKTTMELVKTALLKKYLLTPTKPLIEEGKQAAQRGAGLETQERRDPVPAELAKLEVLEEQLTTKLIAAHRYEASLDGASASELQDLDRLLVASEGRLNRLAGETTDSGTFHSYEHETLGTYYMRDGVIVWDLEDVLEANREIEVEKLGVTEAQLQESIEDRWMSSYEADVAAGRAPQNSEWTAMYDESFGHFMVKEGKVAWGYELSDEQADAAWSLDEVQERGFASVDEYREELVRSWKIANEYAVEAGNASGEWQAGGQSDLVGDYMIKDGVVVWGASNPAEAEEMLPNQLAQNKGFNDLEDLREELESSWRISHQYDVDNGTATGEWQVGGQDEIFGPYMIKDGVVVYGATSDEQAEELLPMQLVHNRGFDSMEEYRENLEVNWREAYRYDEEAGTESDEWQVGGQSDIVGPYMIRRGEIAWGATSVEHADRIEAGIIEERFDLLDDEASDPEDLEPVGELPDELPVDFDELDPDGEFGEGEPEAPVYIVDEPDDGVEFDVRNPPTSPQPDQAALLAELLAEVKALRNENAELREEMSELSEAVAHDEGAEYKPAVMPREEDSTDYEEADRDNDADDGEDGFDDLDDGFDVPVATTHARFETLLDRLEQLGHDRQAVSPPDVDDTDPASVEIREVLAEIEEIKLTLGYDPSPRFELFDKVQADEADPTSDPMADPMALPEMDDPDEDDPSGNGPGGEASQPKWSDPASIEDPSILFDDDPHAEPEVMPFETDTPADEPVWDIDAPMAPDMGTNPDEEQNL